MFDTHLDTFKDWQDGPWGRLRYTVVAANLLRHLDKTPRRVLDVAGGNGIDAARLTARGHEVTVLDVSATMLAEVPEGITTHEGAAEDVASLFAPGSFDVVLVHNLLHYLPDPAAVLRSAIEVLRPGGLLSVLQVNPDFDPLRAAIRQLDVVAALAGLSSPTRFSVLTGEPYPVISADDVLGWLGDLDLDLVGRYGVRCVLDLIPDDGIKSDPAFYADLEALELAMSDRLPYLLTARYFHLFGQRPG
jgi:S-adenosylmethionine-dependent methyltransferase